MYQQHMLLKLRKPILKYTLIKYHVHWLSSFKHLKLPITGNQYQHMSKKLTLKAPITTKVVCFSRLLKCLRSLYGKQCGPRSEGAVCSGFTLFASILNKSVMLGNYLQQTTSADDIFRCIFFLAL